MHMFYSYQQFLQQQFHNNTCPIFIMHSQYFQIEDYHKKVTTTSAQSQKWINRGLMNLFGFNHEGAIKCFKQSIKYDNKCCFAYWAISYSYGPHYNLLQMTQMQYHEGLKYLQLAMENSGACEEWEKDLVKCLKFRYPQNFIANSDQSMKQGLKLTCAQMKNIYEKFPQDMLIAAIYAESIMNLNPWQLWHKNGQPTPQAIIARQVLQKALENGYHPQICHLYLHLMQLSPYYSQCVPVADLLYAKTKGISHLLHMPSHIYIQVGDYLKSLQSNIKAVEADEETIKYMGSEITFYDFYRAHNAHFAVWAAMFLGDYDKALHYSIYTKQLINQNVLKIIGQKAQAYVNVQLHVYIRFGKWKQILQTQIQTRQQYPIYRTIQRYSRCVAYAVLGEVDKAEEQFVLFKEARKNIKDRVYGNNTHEDVLDVAEAMAKGELLYRKAEFDRAFQELRKCVALSDGLIYDQPWDWMQPPRHALGALLLEQNHFQEAEQVYLKDLKTYPDNIWSLTGLLEIYTKQNKEQKRVKVLQTLQKVKKETNCQIKASCFCKKQ